MSRLFESPLSDELIVHIDDKVHSYWTQATIARSMERGAHSFDLALTDSFDMADSAMQNALVRHVQPGMSVSVFINREQIIGGYVDDVKLSYDSHNHSLNISGRSKLADLVDCSTLGKQFQIGQTLSEIASQLCQPFGIQVSVAKSAKSAASEAFKSAPMLDLGQSIWEFLEGLARLKAVLLVSDFQGNLVITRAGEKRAEVALELGKNIKTATGTLSGVGVFSDYTVTGQQAKNASTNVDARAVTQNQASVSSKGLRHRPLVISADAPSDTAACATRANWQKNVSESRAYSITYSVQGWRQKPNGALWEPNALVSVKDPWLDQHNELLITETRMTLDGSGSNTQLHLVPKGAFDLLPGTAS